MRDYILRTTAFNDSVRAFFALTTDMANTARILHASSPVAASALGRLLTASAMLGCTLKDENDQVSLSIKCDGPLGSLLAVSDSKLNVKGYVLNPACDLPAKENGQINLRSAVGSGSLRLIRDMGLKEPYIGQINLVSGEIADDLTYYFAKSEQIPTSVALSEVIDIDTSVKACGGFIIQLMPFAEEHIADMIHENLTKLPPLSTILTELNSPEKVADLVFGKNNYEVTGNYPLRYHCGCSRYKMEKGLISIGANDLFHIATEDKQAELVCHFCNKKYFFNEEDLTKLCERLGVHLQPKQQPRRTK